LGKKGIKYFCLREKSGCQWNGKKPSRLKPLRMGFGSVSEVMALIPPQPETQP